MDSHSKALRLGAAAIICALLCRLVLPGLQEKLALVAGNPNVTSFLIYLETGRNVRFSPSSQVFSPEFAAESPAPVFSDLPRERPAFSSEDAQMVEILYSGSLRPDVGQLLERSLAWDLTGEEPTVLILHTHTTESYTAEGADYEESSPWRTLDENYNMLSVGDALGQLLAKNGITAIHDRTFHDYPSYNGSYTHARKSISQYLEEYPSIRLVLDLHRDASDSASGQLETAFDNAGQSTARLMLVMGTDEAGLYHPGWEENLALGLKLHVLLQRQNPGIMRPLILRTQRFNQDMSPGALLVEVGAAGDSHEEALAAAEALAKAIVTLAKGTA